MRIRLLSWLFLVLLVAPGAGWARAGGTGGHGSSGSGGSPSYSHSSHGTGGHSFSSLDAVLLVLLGGAVVGGWASHRRQARRFRARQAAAQALLARLGPQDARWDCRHLTARVTEVFFRVQHAWTQNDQELARACLSERLYARHKRRTDALLARGRRSVLENIRLTEVVIYSVADYLDDTRDAFVAQVSGSLINYTTNDPQSLQVLASGYPPEEFSEIWTFVRLENRWVLDHIAQAADGSPLAQGLAYSEKVGDLTVAA